MDILDKLIEKANKRALLLSIFDGITHIRRSDWKEVVDREKWLSLVDTLTDDQIDMILKEMKDKLNPDYVSAFCDEEFGYFKSEYVKFRKKLYEVNKGL